MIIIIIKCTLKSVCDESDQNQFAYSRNSSCVYVSHIQLGFSRSMLGEEAKIELGSRVTHDDESRVAKVRVGGSFEGT